MQEEEIEVNALVARLDAYVNGVLGADKAPNDSIMEGK